MENVITGNCGSGNGNRLQNGSSIFYIHARLAPFGSGIFLILVNYRADLKIIVLSLCGMVKVFFIV